MVNGKPFSINPGTSMIDVLGHSGYTFNSAIADLIDNCISANAKNVTLFFSNNKKPYLYILDDGDGMNVNNLKKAAIIADKSIYEDRKDNDLGRYSTGLKSATRSFCNNIIISSKEKGGNANSIQLDYEYISQKEKREAFELLDFKLESLIGPQGTLLYCDNFINENEFFDKKTFYQKLNSLEVFLSHIFGKYLLNGDLTIKIMLDGTDPIYVVGWNPFGVLEDKSTKVIYNKNVYYKGIEISAKVYILPQFNNLSKDDQRYVCGKGLIEQEGFYVYRNNRLIYEGGWLNLKGMKLDDKSKSARIEVNISSALDTEFEINFIKNPLKIPNELENFFIEIAKKAREESHKNFNYLKHPEVKRRVKSEENKVWIASKTNKGLVLLVNEEHPLIKEFIAKCGREYTKRFINLITKSIPISLIQGQNTITSPYSKKEIFDLMDAVYSDLVKGGYDDKTIKRKMAATEPFKEHIEELIKFFEEKEELLKNE